MDQSTSPPTFTCSGNHDIQEERITESLESLFMLEEDDDFREAYFEERLSTRTAKADWILELANTETSTDKLGDWGCPHLRAALDQKDIEPRLILSGHIHSPINNEFKLAETLIRNAGLNIKLLEI